MRRWVLALCALLAAAGPALAAVSSDQEFLARIRQVESGGDYGVVGGGDNGAIGAYQFRRVALEQLGYITVRPGCRVGDWSCVDWTMRARLDLYVGSTQDFLASREAQDIAAQRLLAENRRQLAATPAGAYVGRMVAGRQMTEYDLLAASWMAGAGGTRDYLFCTEIDSPACASPAARQRARDVEAYLSRFDRVDPDAPPVVGPPPVVTPGTGEDVLTSDSSSCLLCPVLTQLRYFAFGNSGAADGFAQRTFRNLAVYASGLARVLAVYSILWLCVRFIYFPDAAREAWKASTMQALTLIIVGFLMSNEGATWVFENIFLMIQDTALGIGRLILMGSGASCPGADGLGGYESIWKHVECIAFAPVNIASSRFKELSLWAVTELIAWLVLMTPYLFIAGIFAAFLIQAMFYIMAVSAAAPLLLTFLVWPGLRGFSTGAFKLVLSGGLTIVFASVAMGFTARVQTVYNQVLLARVEGGSVSSPAGPLPQMCSGPHIVCSGEYWLSFLLGFASVLLHLLAPRIAANISGASDSAATAAGVTAAGSFAGAKAIGAAKGGFGKALDAGGWTFGQAKERLFGLGGSAGDALASSANRVAGYGGEPAMSRTMMESMQTMSLGMNSFTKSMTEHQATQSQQMSEVLDALKNIAANTQRNL